MRRDDRNILVDMAKGAIAGVVATWALDRVTIYLYDHEDERARRREDEVRGGRTAYGVAAEKAAGLAGRELSEEEQAALGSKIHQGLGIGAGAVYGALRGRVPMADLAQGAAFGLAFWLLVDEGANTVLRLTPGPSEFPWQTHARGLAGHLAYGVVADTVLDAVDRVA